MSVGSLLLDPKNPRIPPARQLDAQLEIIQELAIHEDIYDLAKSIATNAFFPNEPLIVVRENGKHYVVEGNRRLAACKLLVSPNMAPSSLEKKFRTLTATFDLQLLSKVPVLVAPSRDSTVPLIISRHTAAQIAMWKPAMQAHFYSNLVEQGFSIDQIAARFGLQPSEIRNELHAHNLYKMACRLDLPDSEGAIVRDPRKFSLTTLKRVFDTPQAKKFFGVEFCDDGSIVGKTTPDEFQKGYSRLVADIATGRQDSRTLHTADNIKTYLTKLPAEAHPNTARKGSFDADTFLSAQVSAKPAAAIPTKKPRTAAESIGLVPSGIQCNVANQRVKNLFKELRKLSPRSFTNACAFTFRSFLEMSVFCFLDSKGEIKTMEQEYLADIRKQNANRPPSNHKKPDPNWTPTLHAMMKRLADPKLGLLKSKHVIKALNKVVLEEQELFGLNLSTHNPTYHPTEPRLRATWMNLEEFFKEILA